ncbi:polysaccharide pyruvyl transferase family protein [Olivibacter jilunii]|uniref:polysaccharide pyruvyl transferase family protein n=1 Tax=Olivibacter jilunii TaxID=985016 RepID=UPI003F13BFC9
MEKIQIDGTNTLNKGAELMLYAILEQIEAHHPRAVVYYNFNERGETGAIDTKLNLKKRPGLKYGRYPAALLKKLKLPHSYFTPQYAISGLELILDGAGFQFSDQWKYSQERLNKLETYYAGLKRKGAKIVLLPQAFGPFETPAGKRIVQIIDKYVDIAIAREKISYDYLIKAGADAQKVWLYPDFTLLVKGEFPARYDHLKGKVCIIPNRKMVTHASSNTEEYIAFLKKIIQEVENNGKDVFLLNHEGSGDLAFCHKINQSFNNKYEVATGLSSKQVKGLIGASYLVVSSRFHGVASALNQGVPCLATSWNHKYEMLFEDFGQSGSVLNVGDDWTKTQQKLVTTILAHDEISALLLKKKEELAVKTNEMWTQIWSEALSN